MDFEFTAEQLAFREEVLRFARNELDDDGFSEREQSATFFERGWEACAAFGIQGLPFSSEFGGSGADTVTTMLAFETLGEACKDAGLLFSLAAQMLSVQMPVAEYGTEHQKRSYLKPMCAGALIGAHAMTEPGSGSDAFSLQTVAARSASGYVLNGSKTFVTNAPLADVFLVFANVNKAQGFMGVTAFLVEKGWSGISLGRPQSKMGLRTSPMAEVVFRDCLVPEESRLGREGAGPEIFSQSMKWERALILSCNLGAMKRQLETCIRHVTARRQFGRPIGKFQAVANKIVDMKVRLDTARLLSYRVASLIDQGKDATMEAAMAKLVLSESWVKSSLDAIQIHGGYGYTPEYDAERELRDSVGGRLYSGTSEIQRNIIAQALGL